MERLIAEYHLSPLHVAAWTGDIEEVNRLVEAGADVNARDTQDATPLHWALKGTSVVPDIFSGLVKHGADVNAQDDAGKTPLHLASSFRNVPAAQRLYELGASLEIKDKEEHIPADRARGKAMNAFFTDIKANQGAIDALVETMTDAPEHVLRGPVATFMGLRKEFDRKGGKGRKTRARKTKRRLTRRRK